MASPGDKVPTNNAFFGGTELRHCALAALVSAVDRELNTVRAARKGIRQHGELGRRIDGRTPELWSEPSAADFECPVRSIDIQVTGCASDLSRLRVPYDKSDAALGLHEVAPICVGEFALRRSVLDGPVIGVTVERPHQRLAVSVRYRLETNIFSVKGHPRNPHFNPSIHIPRFNPHSAATRCRGVLPTITAGEATGALTCPLFVSKAFRSLVI